MKRLSLFVILFLVVVGCNREVQVDGRGVAEWIGLLRHEDWNTRLRAQEILSRLGPPALPYLKRALRSEDPAIRLGVVSTLRKMEARGREALDDLLSQLAREQADSIRAEILRALLAIDPRNEKVQETFRKRLNDQSEQVRAAAQAGLDFSKPAPTLGLDQPAAVPAVKFELREQLQKLLPGGSAALLAEVQRENLRAAIYWPFSEGNPIQSKIMGQLFKRQGESWLSEGEPFELSTSNGAEILSHRLQGSDKQRLFRLCGVKKEDLAERLSSASERFFTALDKKDYGDASEAAEQLAQALDFRLLVFRNTLPWLLEQKAFGQAAWKMEFAPDGGVLAESSGKPPVRYRLELSACASGAVISSLEPLQPDANSRQGETK